MAANNKDQMDTLMQFAKPVLGFTSFSGASETSLFLKLLAEMKLLGLCTGVIRQSHHDVNHPENDCLELKKAGANQVLIASDAQYASATGPGFLIEQLNLKNIDIVMLDGFDYLPFAKIELHRSSMGKQLIFPEDKSVIAVATDVYLKTDGLPLLNINLPKEVAGYINRWLRAHPQAAQSAATKTNC